MTTMRSTDLRFAVNDIRRNKGVTVAVALVLFLASFLLVTGSMVIERMFGSVDRLFADARPPHFLQMHVGELDEQALETFALNNPQIESWFILDMVGFDGAQISFEGTAGSGDFSDKLIDNLFITQNLEFDHLIDEGGAVPVPNGNEVYVPSRYEEEFALAVGDQLTVEAGAARESFTVAGFVRDAQMASSLSSATRFVVSDEGFDRLRALGGRDEVIVEYFLHDPSQASAFQAAYEAEPDLPKNGQAVTHSMILLVNAFSEGLLAIGLVLISFLFMIIAFVSQRFVVKGTLEDQVRQIGAMKAIGIPNRTITRLFLIKYVVLAIATGVVGAALAAVAAPILTREVANVYAPEVSTATVLVPTLVTLIFVGFVILMCWVNVRSANRIQPVPAMVHGETKPNTRRLRRRRSALSTKSPQRAEASLILNDLRVDARQWILVPVIMFVAAIAMILPANLLSTFESPSFVTYMGVPKSDVRVDIQFFDEASQARSEIISRMRGDERIASVQEYGRVLVEARAEEGARSFKAEVGDFSRTTQQFVSGGAPTEGQIALSALAAEELQARVGEQIEVKVAGEPATLTVSGVYQDVTAGGYTARLAGTVHPGGDSYVIYADLVDPAAAETVADDYSAQYPSASVVAMREYVSQTMSYITGAFRVAVILAAALSVAVVALVLGLFLKIRIAKERRRIAVLGALGFTARTLARHYLLKVLLSAVIGIAAGLLFAATLGEGLINSVISASGLGISSFAFDPWEPLVYGLFPALLLAAVFLGWKVVSRPILVEDSSVWLRG
ncbi:MAG: ABC transporter permease [Actinomycetaceae bacterium]|nr:ABC transporter permease [Actinomycetaceae bacterium]